MTAIAALETGNLNVNEIIEDEGIYKFYADYQPTCWIWGEYKLTHGKQNVSAALENSCNYFFYEVGRRMGIDKLDEYAKKFGLGEKTGIELDEEVAGHMASPEYKKEVVASATDREWFGGDTLQAAIGQSYSLFTPIQLANYAATIANGGTRYKVNLIKSVRSMIICNIFIDIIFPYFPSYSGSPVLAALYYGIFLGTGLAIFYMRGSSSGGTDFLTMTIKTIKPYFSIGFVTMSIDLIIISLGWPAFGKIDAR